MLGSMSRMKTKRVAASLLGLAALAGCAGAQSADDYRAALQGVSAEALGLSDKASITVSEEARVGAKWTWKASAGGKIWTCDADDQMRLPSCVQAS